VNAEDERAFREFAAARLPSLLRFAHLVTADASLAEDVVQTALAKTALAWHRIERKDDPVAYVRRAIVNTAANHWRRKPWRERPVAELPDRPGQYDAQAAYDERDAMWRALATLPPKQRAVLVLRYYSGLSEAEIADELGCSRGTVKSQASKALARLRTSAELIEVSS
jgi:RNA polymerase sigma-70 factor (sigma-E family)